MSTGELRRSLLAELHDDDDRFPNTVFSKYVPNRRNMDYISVLVHADWPTVNGNPIRFREIPHKSDRIYVFNTISAIKDFLERSLMADLELVEIRTGCIKILFKICSPISISNISLAIRKLRDNEDRYKVISVSARVGMKRLA